jgi:hypothetical protein
MFTFVFVYSQFGKLVTMLAKLVFAENKFVYTNFLE